MSYRFIAWIISSLLFMNYVTRAQCELEPLPPTPKYQAADVKYEDGGMGPLFDFARSFINTALPDGFPADLIKEIVDGDTSSDIMSLAQRLLQMFKGYVAALVVGFLFVLIVPLVGLCFCCCRLCGNCGGNNKQLITDNMHCVRRIIASVVFVLTVFTLVGNICTFVSNDRMSTSLDKVSDIVDSNLNDIDTFLDHIMDQVNVIGKVNLDKTQTDIDNKLDQKKLRDDMSAFAVNQLGNGALDTLETNIKSVVDAFDAVDKATSEVSSAILASSCPPTTCRDPSSLLQIDTTALDTFKNDDTIKTMDSKPRRNKEASILSISNVKDAVGRSVNIPDLSSMQTKSHKAFDDIKIEVERVQTKITDFRTNANESINIQSYKDQAKTYIDTAKEFDEYRHIAGSVLAGMITLIVILQFLGLVFGSVGQGLQTPPDERGCVSNSGGNMLIASVAFIFIFSWLLMLLTTLSFAVGAILERFVCQPLAPPDFQFLKVAESQFDVTDTLGAPIATVLRDCKAGKSAYEAFHLEAKYFNFTEIEQQMDIQQKKIEQQMRDAMANLRGSTLDTGSAVTDAGNSLDELTNILNKIQFQAMPSVPPNLQTSPYAAALKNLEQKLSALKKFKSKVPQWKTDFVNSLKAVEKNIGNQSASLVDNFQKEVISIGWTFLNTTKRQVRFELGKCTPLWNLYDSIIEVSLCSYIVDAFNGFWFSIGWCLFFFVPSIIFSVKLAKHYRTMNTGVESPGSNKVGPSDDVPLSQY